jgi:hypothetical protein
LAKKEPCVKLLFSWKLYFKEDFHVGVCFPQIFELQNLAKLLKKLTKFGETIQKI